MQLHSLSRGFPKAPEQEVIRDNLVDTIKTISEENDVVLVEGPDGIGKTILLAQFAKTFPDHSISLFIQPTSRLGYTIENLISILAEQIYFANKNEILVNERTDLRFLSSQVIGLERLAKRSGKYFYFLIDGLDDVPFDATNVVESLLKELLPIGLQGFRFIVTGDAGKVIPRLHKKTKIKSFQIPSFSLDETSKYLKDLSLSKDFVEDFQKMCRGIPAHLAIVRRSILSGVPVELLLGEDPETLPEFIEMEWNRIDTSNDDLRLLLAILSFGDPPYSVSELALITGIEQEKLRTLLLTLPIIDFDQLEEEINFLSAAHKRFAERELKSFKERSQNLIIKYLMDDLESSTSLKFLPSYLSRTERHAELVQVLRPEHFAKILQTSESFFPLKNDVAVGLSSSIKSQNNEGIVRFSIHNSLLMELEKGDYSASEIKALMATGDVTSAYKLAQSAPLKEDRLQLFSVIASVKSENDESIEPELLNRISLLIGELTGHLSLDRAISIAIDLLPLDPDLALKLAEGCTEEDEFEKDLALGQLSIMALRNNKADSEPSGLAEVVRSKVKDQRISEFFAAIGILFSSSSAIKALESIQKVDSKHRMLFLRQWALTNRKRDDAFEVISYALDFLLKESGIISTLKDLRELATPLPYLQDISKSQDLVKRFDSHKGFIETIGSSEDYVRLNLLLARAESKSSRTAAFNRLIELYWYVGSLKDLSIKTACLAWILGAIQDIDPDEYLESTEGFNTVLNQDYIQSINLLLDNSAEQLDLVRGCLRAFVRTRIKDAVTLSLQLNTESRRQDALAYVVSCATEHQFSIDRWVKIWEAIQKINSDERRDSAIENLVKWLERTDGVQAEEKLTICKYLLIAIQSITDPAKKCVDASRSVKILQKLGILSSADFDEFKTIMNDSWSSIDRLWIKKDTSFRIGYLLAKVSPDLGREYIKRGEEISEKNIFSASRSISVFVHSLLLNIRATASAFEAGIISKIELEKLSEHIENIPSYGDQIFLWSDLAQRLYLAKRTDEGSEIVFRRIKPLLDLLPEQDKIHRSEIILSIAPALYKAHSSSALELFDQLPTRSRDEAYRNTANFIMRKIPFTDPYKADLHEGFSITFEEALDVCELLQRISTDSEFYNVLSRLSSSLILKRNATYISRPQKNDIAKRLEEMIAEKLPDRNNIQHEGFKIICYAEIARIKDSHVDAWNNIVKSTDSLSNLADRAYVYVKIAERLPKSKSLLKTEVLAKAKETIRKIPADLDRVSRLLSLAEACEGVSLTESKKLLEEAMQICISPNLSSISLDPQKDIIDLAHKIDPDFANTLAALTDDDPAHQESVNTLKSHIKSLNISKEMIDQRPTPSVQGSKEIIKAAWLNLGRLNAGRIPAVHFEQIRDWIVLAGDFTLTDAYPIYAWTFENTIKRLKGTQTFPKQSKALLVASSLSSDLVVNLSTRVSTQLDRIRKLGTSSGVSESSILIKSGERDKALCIVRDWLEANADTYLIICDPYFGAEDLEALKLVQSTKPFCSVRILTSKKKQEHDKHIGSLDEVFLNHWRSISDVDPPNTEIVLVETASSGIFPIHDRWWITDRGGLRMGTSFNSLGFDRFSEIGYLTDDEAHNREIEIISFLDRKKTMFNGEKLRYVIFGL